MRRKQFLGIVLVAAFLAGVAPAASSAAIPAPVSAPADAGWPIISSGIGPRDIDFVDSSRGWAAGSAGYVHRTTDGGATWTARWTGTRANLLAVDFVDGQFGWAVGGDATVVATQDGGLTWTTQLAPTSAYFPIMPTYTGVSFLDHARGWIVTRFSVLETTDGGGHWSVAYLDGEHSDDLRRIEFVDALHGWATGFRGAGHPVVLRTVDGGRTWRGYEMGGYSNGASLIDSDFVDASTGWVVSPIGIHVTHDGGVTWVAQLGPQPAPSERLATVSFSDTLHGYALSYIVGMGFGADTPNPMFRTTDGGETWVRSEVSWAATGLVALDALHVRATVEGNTVMASDDGAQTWTPRRVAVVGDQGLHAVDFVDAQHGWVVGAEGVIRRTEDGGASWANQASGTTEPLYDVDFVDLLHGTAVGGFSESPDSDPGIVRTTVDGGATWTPRVLAAPAPVIVRSVSMVDAQHGWVAGNDGVQATSDGGLTWVARGSFSGVTDVFFLDLQHGYALSIGHLFLTADGGATWTERDPHVIVADGNYSDRDWTATAVVFTDVNHGWVAGGRRISRTVDGGATWSAQELWHYNSPVEYGHPSALAFVNAQDGWAATMDGYVFSTHDGGATWLPQPTLLSQTWRLGEDSRSRGLFDVAVVDTTHGWAVGSGGTILRNSLREEPELVLSSTSVTAAGRPVTLDVAVGPSRFVMGPQAGTATGGVEITQNGTVLGTAALAAGVGHLATAALTPGRHVFTARYLGDARFGPTPPVMLRLDAPRPLVGWGFNRVGDLGSGTITDSLRPVPATSAPKPLVVAGAAGAFHSLAVTDDGNLYVWGWNPFMQLGLGAGDDRLQPTRVLGIDFVRQAAGGAFHSLAVTADGRAWSWGWNGHDQLGLGPATEYALPTPVPGLGGVVSVAAGAVHSLALKSDGTVWAWGFNGLGQLGDGTTAAGSAPVRVAGLTGVVAIAAGSHHSLALKADGSVWAWGWNVQGQLGDGTTVDRPLPIRVPGLSARSISGGAYHSLAARTDGTVVAWGWNGVGQLGDGTTVNHLLPAAVPGVTGATAVAAGAYHSLALVGSGSVRAWGWNYFGQLGDGTTVDRPLAVAVPGVTAHGFIAAGSVHSLAL